MKHFVRLTLVTLAFGLLATALSVLPSKRAAATSITNVDVVNTPSVNIANAPSVNIANTPTVFAQVTNTPSVSALQNGGWTVGVNNFPATQSVSGTVNVSNFPATQPVTFTNSSSNPLFVDANGPARSPVSGECSLEGSLADGTLDCNVATAPTGKTLVIDYLSFRIRVAAGKPVWIAKCNATVASINGGTTAVSVAPAVTLLGSNSAFSFSQGAGPVVVYVPSGQTVLCEAQTQDASDADARLDVDFIGHLVD